MDTRLISATANEFLKLKNELNKLPQPTSDELKNFVENAQEIITPYFTDNEDLKKAFC